MYDPIQADKPYGFIEVKCPYSSRNLSPAEACEITLFSSPDGVCIYKARYGDHGFIEVKCPYSLRNSLSRSIFCMLVKN